MKSTRPTEVEIVWLHSRQKTFSVHGKIEYLVFPHCIFINFIGKGQWKVKMKAKRNPSVSVFIKEWGGVRHEDWVYIPSREREPDV